MRLSHEGFRAGRAVVPLGYIFVRTEHQRLSDHAVVHLEGLGGARPKVIENPLKDSAEFTAFAECLRIA